MLTFLYSDLGIPKGYRFMEGNSVHAYKFVNAARAVTYVKLKWTPMEGVRNLTMEEAAEVQASSFGHATDDLYSAIKSGDYPSWELGIQKMKPEQMNDFKFNPLDATKDWPVDQFPAEPIGKLTLDKVPDNFHVYTEQSAFSPGNFLPGAIEPSEDRLLQGRLVSYHESQVHRIGSNNYQELPPNRPNVPVRNYNADGVMAMGNSWGANISNSEVNYEPNNSEDEFQETNDKKKYTEKNVCGAYEQAPIDKTLNFGQAGDLYRSFSDKDKQNLIDNLKGDLGGVESQKIRDMMCSHFYKADEEYGTAVGAAVKCDMKTVKALAAKLVD